MLFLFFFPFLVVLFLVSLLCLSAFMVRSLVASVLSFLSSRRVRCSWYVFRSCSSPGFRLLDRIRPLLSVLASMHSAFSIPFASFSLGHPDFLHYRGSPLFGHVLVLLFVFMPLRRREAVVSFLRPCPLICIPLCGFFEWHLSLRILVSRMCRFRC